MIDDSGLVEFGSSSRARRSVFTLAAVSLAAISFAACADEDPPDDAVAADLSTREVLALCDELRDVVESDPPRCGSDGNVLDALPTNESCVNADLSACTVTVGELRRCNERAMDAECLFVTDRLDPISDTPVTVDCQAVAACDPFLPFF